MSSTEPSSTRDARPDNLERAQLQALGADPSEGDPDDLVDAQLRALSVAAQGQANILNLDRVTLERSTDDSTDMDQPRNTRGVQASRHVGVPEPRPAHTNEWFDTPLEGPALPRWVPSHRVDSQAMLSAFLHHRTRCSLAALEPLTDLYLIDHRMGDPLVTWGGNTFNLVANTTPGPVPTVPCLTPHCTRCALGHGGYKFKWDSERWARGYNALRRPNTWAPGDPEDPTGPPDIHPSGFRMPAPPACAQYNTSAAEGRGARHAHDCGTCSSPTIWEGTQ